MARQYTRPKAIARRRGAAMVIALVTLLVITLLSGAIVRSLLLHLRQTRVTAIELQALALADAALARAAVQIRANGQYDGETWRAPTNDADDAEHTGVADIRVARSGDRLTIEVLARYPDNPTRRVLATRRLEISAKNTEPSAGRGSQETAP
jgi:Tfp pilus assembly protein PilX